MTEDLYKSGMAQPVGDFASKLEQHWDKAFKDAGWPVEYIGDRCTWADFQSIGLDTTVFIEIKPFGPQFRTAAADRARQVRQPLLIAQDHPRSVKWSFHGYDATTQSWVTRQLPAWIISPRLIGMHQAGFQKFSDMLRKQYGGFPRYFEEDGERPSGYDCIRCGERISLDFMLQEYDRRRFCDYCDHMCSKDD